ncbi:MAG: tetratricopeptide repeat protein [candidate division WOR-3 bacterium]|nr:tetratricopeptide repeat protein [candidate division WOR-3 bacterium]
MPDPTHLRVLYVRSRPLVQYARPDGEGGLADCSPDEEGAVAVPVPALDDRLELGHLVEILDSAGLPVSIHLLPHATGEDFTLELSRGYEVVYFDGHGSETTLAFEGPNGECHDLDATTLAAAFEDSGAKLAVLSACHSAAQLDAICQAGVPATVGMTNTVPQAVAAAYARGFFTALIQGKPLAQAHKLGLKMVKAKMSSQPSDEELPTLLPTDADIALISPGATGKLELTGGGALTSISLPDKPFVGREEIQVSVNRALEKNRVVVLEGEGGIGKTALAQHVALWQAERNKCPGGAAFVSFDPPLSRDLAIDAIGVALFGSDFSKAQGNHLDILKSHFSDHPGLVVLDNFESVRTDPEIHALIQALSPHARILVTTREHIGIGQTIRVKELDDAFATMLFVVLAAEAGWDGTGDEDTVKAICRELGNMPLAIELVAPQAAALSLQTVLDRVKENLAAVAADRPGMPARQRSLTASLDLSYSPLSEPAKLLFRRFSVFASGAMGFMLPDVCDIKDWEKPATEMVERRLVRFEDDRYVMLPPVRRYALDRLAAAVEKDKCEERFADFCTSLASAVHEQMNSKDGANWIGFAGTERNNLLAAQRWFLEHDKWDEAAGMANLLDDPFDRAGLWAARRELHAPLRDYAEQHGRKKDQAVDLHQLAVIAQDQGDYAEARKLYDQSLAIEKELGNKSGIALTLGQIASLAMDQGDYDDARAGYEKILTVFKELADKASTATTFHQLGTLAQNQGDLAEARKLYDQSLAIAQELGDKVGIAKTQIALGNVALGQGDRSEARDRYAVGLQLVEQLGAKEDIAMAHGAMGQLAQAENDDRTALRNYVLALAIFEELKSPCRDLATQLIAEMQKRLGKRAFKKLYDEVAAELGRPTAHG